GRLHLAGQALGLLQKRGPLLLGGGANLLAEALLLGAQRIGGGDGFAAPHVGLEKPVHEGRVLATGALRIAHDIRVVAEEFQIDHAPRVPGPPDRHSRPAAPCHMNATPSTPNTTPATKSTHGPTATMRRTTASVDTASAMKPNHSTDVPNSA